MTPKNLPLKYLNASVAFGRRAGRIDREFCIQVLGIKDPDQAIRQIRDTGINVVVDEKGVISLAG